MSHKGSVWTPPILSSFTQNNQANATSFVWQQVGNTICAYIANTGSGDHPCGLITPVPGSYPYSCILNFSVNPGTTLNNMPGDGLCTEWGWQTMNGSSVSGSIRSQYRLFNGGGNLDAYFEIYTGTGGNALVAYNSSAQGYAMQNITWYMMRDDGTYLYWYISTEEASKYPHSWVLVYKYSRIYSNSWTPTHLVFGANPYINVGKHFLTLNSWKVENY